MNISQLKSPTLYDQFGKPVSPAGKLRNNAPGVRKQAFGLYGNIYNWQNSGKYRQRYYTLGDSSQGLDTLSRELLVRWSREMYGQLPFVKTATRALADFAIGSTYLPLYSGTNKSWWKKAEEWLLAEWYPNCNVRGPHYDFQTGLRLESSLLDVDGDHLLVFGSEDGFPKFQIIQNNRIRSNDRDNIPIGDGPMAGTTVSDGLYYSPQGRVMGYNIQNPTNMVNQMAVQSQDLVLSARDAYLVLDPEFIDKLRGVPAIGSAILQALSIQELDQYLMEKIKIEASVALIEKNSTGQAPVELQNTLEQLLDRGDNAGLQAGAFPPNVHAVEVVQGSDIRYVQSDGGEIKSLASNSPAGESMEYMERLETQILSTIGVPHTLCFSTDKVSGRITSGVAEMFRSAIQRRQSVTDKTARLRVSIALAKAMEAGFIPGNDEDNISRVINFTHPPEFSLDKKYDSQIMIEQFQSGFSTLDSVTTKLFNRTAEDILDTQAKEQVMFYNRAAQVAKETGVDISVVIAGWRQNLRLTRPPESIDAAPGNEDSAVQAP